MIDLAKLEKNLNNLRGLDFEEAESMTRRNPAYSLSIEISLLKEFQARLAALALEIPYEDIRDLPIREYSQVCTQVVNFLFANSAEPTPSTN